MRIVSLLGSATEIVYELGLEDHLVGISHECDHPAAALSLPRVSRPRFDPAGLTSGEVDAAVRRCMEEHGSVYGVDRELLARLEPTMILTQGVCEVCAVPTGTVWDAVAELESAVEVLALDAHRMSGIFLTIRQVADAAGVTARGEKVVSALQGRLERVAAAVADRPRPRVLLLEWLDPPFAPGHWVPEMVGLAGAENLLGEAGARSIQVQWDAVAESDPDILLVEPCGYDLEQAAADADRHRTELLRTAPRAIREERAWVLHSAWFSRSGPRVVEGVEALAALFHPDRFPRVDIGDRARGWA